MRTALATARMISPLATCRIAPRPARALLVRASSSASSAATASPAEAVPRPSWDIRLLYDGDCPLCLKEVNFLRSRNQAGKVVFVDIASPEYDPAQNAGISFEQAMATIHGVTAEGRVYTGVEVFRLVYEAVGLGWVYAITKNPAVLALANSVYDVWAKYRTQLTGREALEVLLERRKLEAAGKASCRTVDAATGDAKQCDL
ncbi:hypothetical protein PLESTB_001589300 [Pleodorina starrii]|uniref:Thiol-disulfide oxidoreductase DCC n=1 Tax=Pleodorina starrii TaxID=330485 RepID=A0A9W6BX87_9CHLO|nr:hypothetical protein PLESTM_000581600 [Pleodorina starrii]GLC60236.1 hypothetical protein PLESTB_001589300 [Pleodorina starrii]GLC65998.1 hypothetical protein PLESTF_000370900 [Pleodorina starrii]